MIPNKKKISIKGYLIEYKILLPSIDILLSDKKDQMILK